MALLTVARERAEEIRAQFGDPDLNVSRIAPDDRFWPITTVNGGGKYLSLLSGSNDSNLAPTIRIDAGRFVCAEDSTALGVILDLGDVSWSVAQNAALDHPQARVLLGIELGMDLSKPWNPKDPKPTERLKRAVAELGKTAWFTGAAVELGHTYVARLTNNFFPPPDATILFRPIDRDANGFLTIGWRRLEAQ